MPTVTAKKQPASMGGMLRAEGCPAKIRTWNLLVQSQALCQLSYRAFTVFLSKTRFHQCALCGSGSGLEAGAGVFAES